MSCWVCNRGLVAVRRLKNMFSVESESQKYNQESESDTAFACVAGPAECITGDSWRPEGWRRAPRPHLTITLAGQHISTSEFFDFIFMMLSVLRGNVYSPELLTSWKYPDTWYKREYQNLTHRGLCEYNYIMDAWTLCLVSHHRVRVCESICKENQAILILETKIWHKETSIICSLENYASFNLRRIQQLLATTMLIWPPSYFL